MAWSPWASILDTTSSASTCLPHHENDAPSSELYSASRSPRIGAKRPVAQGGPYYHKSDPGTIVLMSRPCWRSTIPDTCGPPSLHHYRLPIAYGPSRRDEIVRGLLAFRNLFDGSRRMTASPSHLTPQSAARMCGASIDRLHVRSPSIRQLFWDSLDDEFNTGVRPRLGSVPMVRVLIGFATPPSSTPTPARRRPRRLAPRRRSLREAQPSLRPFPSNPPWGGPQSSNQRVDPALLTCSALRTQLRHGERTSRPATNPQPA